MDWCCVQVIKQVREYVWSNFKDPQMFGWEEAYYWAI